MTDNSTRSMSRRTRRKSFYRQVSDREQGVPVIDVRKSPALIRRQTRVIKLHTSRHYLCLRICIVSPDATLVPAVSGKTYGTSQEGRRDGIGTRSVYDSGNDSPSRRHDVASMASFFVTANK
ncbi:uncharacterized protein ARMOST_14344 [Armillaria ostoyae]|uniref:Uncharacterized protein n=1 Tax=Armillaria ostoyae TaxID=47428 RepID=A0A284RQD9_ARMOS|nr:uncharacterized protein ARMOST_14344 [Armillaria ostoyae]